jgi:hypothetical protein
MAFREADLDDRVYIVSTTRLCGATHVCASLCCAFMYVYDLAVLGVISRITLRHSCVRLSRTLVFDLTVHSFPCATGMESARHG